jgi:D-glycero-D-manno-heptose 1,7-bisphosphate phosphatase
MLRQPQRYVLLDRDGVINRRVLGGYVTSWEQFEFLPHALPALKLLKENGYASVVISNQAGVGKRLMSVAALELITHRFLTEVALAGGNITQVYYCVHVAEDNCACRKPRSGLIERAQLDYGFAPQDTFFIGDSPEDMEAAANAGCPAILVRREAFLGRQDGGSSGTGEASNLYEAAQMVIERQRPICAWMQSPSQPDERMRSLRVGQN